MREADFVGTWRLISLEARSSDGTVTYPWGVDARGFIMYAADGHVSVAISRAERAIFGTADLLAGSEAELAAAARTYISYAVFCLIKRNRVRHAVDVSLFPDWVGSTQG